jgi:DNA-binding response OmpR family regulator
LKRKWQIIVSGDKTPWSTLLTTALREDGIEADFWPNWADAVSGRNRTQPDALLLLATDPSLELLDICRTACATSSMAVVFLSEQDDEVFAVDALEAGADDFLLWPLNPGLFTARMRAILRRVERFKGSNEPITIRDLSINLLNHEVTMKKKRVDLTPTEFRILACLVRNAGQVIPSHMLLKEAQGYDCGEQEAQDIVKVHIRRLRNKLEPNPNAPTYVINVRGFGYMLERRMITRETGVIRAI